MLTTDYKNDSQPFSSLFSRSKIAATTPVVTNSNNTTETVLPLLNATISSYFNLSAGFQSNFIAETFTTLEQPSTTFASFSLFSSLSSSINTTTSTSKISISYNNFLNLTHSAISESNLSTSALLTRLTSTNNNSETIQSHGMSTLPITSVKYVYSVNMTINEPFDSDFSLINSTKRQNMISNVTQYV